MPDNKKTDLADLIRERCRADKITLRSLSIKTGIPQRTIQKILDGAPPSPDEDTINCLADFLGEKVSPEKNEAKAAQSAPKPNDGNHPKAVVFTHLSGLKYDTNGGFQKIRGKLVERYTHIFTSYLQCNIDRHRIAIVYSYFDWLLKIAMDEFRRNKDNDEGQMWNSIRAKSDEEFHLRKVLEEAEGNARNAIKSTYPIKFYHIGLKQLVGLVNKLRDVEPELLSFLFGRITGRFTYDSPKFVEAIIRLARGDMPYLARHPIIRIDDDAKPNPRSIDLIMEAYQNISKNLPFFFLSGQYGREDGVDDPVNDYAVRTAYFFPIGTRPGDPRFKDKSSVEFQRAWDHTNMLLSDLSFVGATQGEYFDDHSLNAVTILSTEECHPRPAPQVISGAGLIMSRRAIEFLPPFMNFNKLTMWVDDHLKRRLHEALGDIEPGDQESIIEARFEQNRHPEGIQKKDLEWAKNEYFERLLRGCLMQSLIEGGDGKSTVYSNHIHSIVAYKDVLPRDAEEDPKTKRLLLKEMSNITRERYENTLRCWSSKEFKGTILYEWASSYLSSSERKKELCREVIEDAWDYIRLVRRWPIFIRAISRLKQRPNKWLYHSVDQETD